MSHPIDVRAEIAPMNLGRHARGVVRWVCTNNPFYVLSALMVCLGLWISFGAQVRPEQTWALMFGMAAYTLLLAVPACLLVRFGGVWQDVRTVLLLVVLMFLATSVTFDETLARDEGRGVACYLAGLAFAVAVSEGMLRAIRLVLPGWFRASYYGLLGLFFLYPVALVPLLDRPRSEELQWALFGFGPCAAIASMALLPAIRRGPDYVRDNGSPWRWPMYPWSLFVFLGVGLAARSFLLCWSMQHVPKTDPERYIFGPYFLVPIGLAVAVLLLEMGLVARNRGAIRAAMLLPIGLVVLSAIGDRPDPLFLEFRAAFIARLGGTPLYLTLIAASGFYVYAWLRGVRPATEGLSLAVASMAVYGPGSIALDDFTASRAWPILAVAALQLGLGLARRDAWRCLIGAAGAVGAMLIGPGAMGGRGPVAFHLALFAVMALGAAFDDGFGRLLRNAASAMAVLAAMAALGGRLDRAGSVPAWAVAAYPPMLAALLAGYGAWLRHRPALASAAVVLACWASAIGWRGYSAMRDLVAGLDLIAAGLALLVLAEAISLGKAGLLRRLVARGKGRARRLAE